MNQKGLLIIVSGPSGAGKGTLCKSLLKRDSSLIVSVSATTRSPRDGEVDGVSYHFYEKEDFLNRIEANGFLEYAKVYDNYYGTPKDFVIDHISRGENVLLEIDIQGAIQVKQKYPEGVFVFVLPPSMKTLRDRIVGRGSETPESLEKRMSCAMNEIESIRHYDYFVVNDQVEWATDQLQAILLAEKCRVRSDISEVVLKFKEEKQNVKSVD